MIKRDKMIKWGNNKNLSPLAFIAKHLSPLAFIAKHLSPQAFIAKHLSPLAFIIILMFTVWQAQAQEGVPERLAQIEQEVASGTLSDEEMYANYRLLIDHYRIRDIEKTKQYFRKGIDFAREKKRVEWEAHFYGKMGGNYLEWGERDTFLIYMDKVLELIEDKGHCLLESEVYKVMATFYLMQNQLVNALSAYHQSLELIEKDKNKQLALKQDVTKHNLQEAYIIIDMGSLYYDMRNLEKAVEHMLRAKQILDDNPHDDNPLYEIIILENLAQYYMEMGKTDKVLPLALRAYEMAHELEYIEYVVFAARLLSDYWRTEKDLKQALQYAKEALQIAEQTQLSEHLNWADMAMMETSRAMKDYQAALFYAGRMADRTDEDDWDALQTLYKGLIMIYSSMNNPGKTEEYLNKFNDLTTKISDKNLHDALQEMEVKYEVSQKDLDIERKQAEIERQRSRLYLSLGGLIAIGLLVVLLAYNSRLRARRNLALTQRNEALSVINTTKDKFFSIISHDLKNPAEAQRNALQVLVNHIRLWDADTLSAYSNELLNSAESHVGLVYNLLGWARLQTGRMTYTPATFSLSSCLRPDMTLIRNMAEKKGIAFSGDIPGDVSVTGDKNMLSTVVRNLLTNAVKFTAEGGTVSLAVEPTCESKYTIFVTDTGTGMSREQLEKLFRLDSAHSIEGTDGEQGSGLGLIVCKEFLKQHETELHVESEVGKGSRFWFEVKA